MAKMSEFIIGIVLFCLFIAVVSITAVHLNEKYPLSTYNAANLNAYNNLNRMANLTQKIDTTSKLEQNPSFTDILGFYLGSGYKVLTVSKESYNTFDNMTQTSLQNAELGEMTSYFRIAISTIVLIIIVLGILVATIVNRDT